MIRIRVGVLVALATVLFASSEVSAADKAQKGRVTVTAPEAKIMIGRRELATVTKGDVLQVAKRKGNWLAVKLSRDGTEIRGWIRVDKVSELVEEPAQSTKEKDRSDSAEAQGGVNADSNKADKDEPEELAPDEPPDDAARAAWDEVKDDLVEIMDRESKHADLPKSSIRPWVEDQESNRKKINRLMDEALSHLEVSGVSDYRTKYSSLEEEIRKA